MPIPQLSKKIYSPQGWKQQSHFHDSGGRQFFYKRKKRRPIVRSIVRSILSLVLLGFFCVVIFVMISVAWISRNLPNPDKIIERAVPLSTKIYDRTGEHVLFDIHGEQKRTFIHLEEIPETVKQSTLTAEDRRFYGHKGVSFTGIIRSALKNVTTGSRAGGSTLTQQFIKNAVLSPEKTYARKIKEVILSYRLEKKFSKDEILQMYFNEIPYGSTAYGVEAAAQTYFGKSARDVNLAEAAILAALPKAPTYYSPYGNNRDKLIIRQHWVLDGMVEEGYITEKQSLDAKAHKLEFKKLADDIIAPHFVTFVREYLSQKYGEKTVEQEGLRVITTLDTEKQKIAEEAIFSQAEKNLSYNASNAALVAIDPKTGHILAMVGSKDFFDEEIDGQVNVVIRPRQPGSSFKPIVYAAAFKKGFTPDTVLYDVNTTFINYDQKPYEPKNYTLEEHGLVTMRQALAGSLNIPAVKTIYVTGIANVLDLADEVGYTTLKQRSRFGLALVLGGGEVKLLEHTQAFATLAREGQRPEITAILRVEDREGQLLEEFKENSTKVLETEVSRLVVDIMSDNDARAFVFGQVNYLTLPGRRVAVKTGTTNDFRDAWTLGFTPSLAAGVWVGNNDFTPMKEKADGSAVAAPIWQQFMTRALEGSPVEQFTKPKPIEVSNPALNGSFTRGITVKVDTVSGKRATEYTPPHLIVERTYNLPHDILHYVDKDNPRGAQPVYPEKDQQYQAWELALQDWAKKNNITLDDAPTETDDVHVPENKPQLTILEPLDNETVTERSIKAQVYVQAPGGVQKIEYYLNDKLLRTSLIKPFSLTAEITDPYIENGPAQLTVIAFDVYENTTQKHVRVNMSLPEPESKVVWESPKNGSIISKKDYPLLIKINIKNPQNVSRVHIMLDDGAAAARKLYTFTSIASSERSFNWATYPGIGTIGLYAEVENLNGASYQTPKIILDVK